MFRGDRSSYLTQTKPVIFVYEHISLTSWINERAPLVSDDILRSVPLVMAAMVHALLDVLDTELYSDKVLCIVILPSCRILETW